MGAIYLIRHGQASFGTDDYDQLSPLGHQQATVLGQALQLRAVKPDLVVCGSMRRHRQTADGCLQAMTVNAELQQDAAWNEYDHEGMVTALHPHFVDKAQMHAELAKSANPRRAFQDIFFEAMRRWASGQHDGDYVESWPDFRSRVDGALRRLRAQLARSQTALVFTSGGPISVVAARLLGLDDERTLRLNSILANAAVTKLIYSERSLYLSSLNEHAHFEAASALISYR